MLRAFSFEAEVALRENSRTRVCMSACRESGWEIFDDGSGWDEGPIHFFDGDPYRGSRRAEQRQKHDGQAV